MEIGSFIEMQFPRGNEYHNESKYGKGIARLNSGRAAVYHAARCLGCDTVYLPYYQCDTVRDFLIRKGIDVRYYWIGRDFTPMLGSEAEAVAVVIVNYYGIMSHNRMTELASRFKNVIIDNSQAFYNAPVKGCMNVYSARKFVGVPDGAYVVGEGAGRGLEFYGQDHSSDTAGFLLQRIEYGCEGKTYELRILNEHRIDRSDIMIMSELTRAILDGTDYDDIRARRRENFAYADELFAGINRIDPFLNYDPYCVPMVYPLVTEDDGLLKKLLDAKHFQGHWWSYLLNEVPEDRFEYWLSRYVIPITIDQRYGKVEISYIRDVIQS